MDSVNAAATGDRAWRLAVAGAIAALLTMGSSAQAAQLYWTDAFADVVRRSDLNGDDVQTLVSTGLEGPTGIAVDPAGGRMYYGNAGLFNPSDVQSADLDGGDVAILDPSAGFPGGIAVDPIGGHVYWGDTNDALATVRGIHRASLDGSAPTQIHNVGRPFGLALDIPVAGAAVPEPAAALLAVIAAALVTLRRRRAG